MMATIFVTAMNTMRGHFMLDVKRCGPRQVLFQIRFCSSVVKSGNSTNSHAYSDSMKVKNAVTAMGSDMLLRSSANTVSVLPPKVREITTMPVSQMANIVR